MAWVNRIEIRLRKSKVLGDMDEVVKTRSDLMDLMFYPEGSHIYIEDEKQVYQVVHKMKTVWKDEESEAGKCRR